MKKDLKNLRREYGAEELNEKNILLNPFNQFKKWLEDAIENDLSDPNAMVLATVDNKGYPDTRVVLLKEITQTGFIFFTHYDSPKAKQAEKLGVVALNFYWNVLARQVRIKGNIKRISPIDSAHYFSSRPRESQLCTVASKQSERVKNRETLLQNVKVLTENLKDQTLTCPSNWGGYCVIPFEFEFFQGRDNRLNDRIVFEKINEGWEIYRLSP